MRPVLYLTHLPASLSRCRATEASCRAVSSSLIIPQELHFYFHVRNDPLGLGEVFDDEEMFGEDLEGDLVGGVFGDDPGCDPVGDSVIIDSFESISFI